MHTHMNTDGTQTCILCDAESQPGSRFCVTCNTDTDVPTCPCGAALSGSGSYCTSFCAEVHGHQARRSYSVALGLLDIAAKTETQLASPEAEDTSDDEVAPRRSSLTPAQHLRQHLSKEPRDSEADVPSAQPKRKRPTRPTCAFCINKTRGVCRCQRPLCGPCADEETGLCPHCADSEE